MLPAHALARVALFVLLVAAAPTAAPRTVLARVASGIPTHAGAFHPPTASANPITEFPIPNSASNLQDIAAGPGGSLWFTGAAGGDAAATPHKVGRITTGGAVSAFALPITSCQPLSISAGPDGNLWFIEQFGGVCAKVGRITTTGTITEFALPSASSIPDDITSGPDGNVWFTEQGANRIGRITTSGVVTEFAPATNSGPAGITAGPDGNLWFTENAANKIGRITTAGAITEFPVTTVGSAPTNIASGPDGNLWFTEALASKIGRITPAGVVTEFPLSPAASAAEDIARGPDGNLWFSEAVGGATGVPNIGRMTTSGVVTDFPIPSGATGLQIAIAAGADGNLWFSDSEANDIGRITTAGTTTRFPVPGFNLQQTPNGILAGPDGNLWYAEAAEIARLTPAGMFTEYPIPTAVSIPGGMAAGPDGNLWFTEIRVGKIGRITPGGVITEFSIPTAKAPTGIAAGPDGNLWFIESVEGNPGSANVGRITTSGVITVFQPIASSAFGIAAGPDGNLWFTEKGANKIGRITTAGTITEFPIPTGFAYPTGITAGPDGNLWFTELGIDKIARITTAGTITEFPVATANAYLVSIATGPDGNLWFTEGGANNIGRITTAGTMTEFPIPTFNSYPLTIAAGPDGNVWFTEQFADQVGRVTLTTGLGAPTALHSVAGDGEATLTWTPPPNTGPAISGYTVTASPGGTTTTVSPLIPAATVTGLTNGTPYTFTVSGVNAIGTGPASAPSGAVTPTAVAKGPSVAVLPAMSNGAYGGYLTTAYLENLGASAAHVRVQYFDTAGLGVGSGNSVAGLAAGGTWTLRTDNGDSLAAAQPGSAVVYSDQPLGVFVNEFAPGGTDATSYTAISVPSGTGGTLFAPAIANNAYGGYTTGIGLINLSSSAVNITVTYRDGLGTVAKTQNLNSVAGGAYVPLYSGDPALGLADGFAGTATITSSGGNLAAVVNETGPGFQFSSYDAVPTGSTTLYAPVALNNAFGGYNTGMGIQNTTGSAGTVTISYYDTTGLAATTTFPIVANGYIGVYQGTDIPAAGAYTAKITSTVAIAAIVNEVAPSATSFKQSTAYNTFAAGSSSLHLPLVESSGADGWSTGEGIMNTGSAATMVTVTYYDTVTGLTIGTPQSLLLQPNAFWGLYQPAGGLPIGARASAVVTTSAGGQVAVICNESNATSFMSYTGI